MTTRTFGIFALLALYGALALYLADDRLHIALYGLPIVLLSCMAAVRRLNSPNSNTLVGIGSFVLVSAIGVADWTPLLVGLGTVQLVIVAVFGLLLVELHTGEPSAGSLSVTDEEPLPIEQAHALVASELRRSRRTGVPVSLLLLRPSDSLEPSCLRDLVRSVKCHAREFDTVFMASRRELGILCPATDRAGALCYADRIRTKTQIQEFSAASFPGDAVTSQALFDAARQRPTQEAPELDVIAVSD